MPSLNIFEGSNSGQLFILEEHDKAIKHDLVTGIKNRKEQLLEIGLKKGHKVILCMGNTAAFSEYLFAVWELEACAVPVSSLSTENEIKTISSLVEPALTIYDDESKNITHHENFSSADGDFLILHTSGSSGIPKGVILSREVVLDKLNLYRQHLPNEDFQNTLCMLPLNFGHGLISNFLFPLCSGKNVFLAPSGRMDIYSQLGKIIDEFSITTFSSVPSILKIASNFSDMPEKRSLKKIYCASASLDKATWHSTMQWSSQTPFCNMYGLTELASWIAASEPSSGHFEENVFNVPWATEVKIVKNDENDDYGEIFLKSNTLMKGYFKNPSATQRVVHEGWFRTGDLGIVRQDKMILKGRLDDVINLSGIKVYPEEVNQEIRRHDKVADCFTLGLKLEGAHGDYTIACVIVPIRGSALEPSEIRTFCKSHLSSYKIPSQYKIIDKFPLNSRGKIDRKALRDLFAVGTGTA